MKWIDCTPGRKVWFLMNGLPEPRVAELIERTVVDGSQFVVVGQATIPIARRRPRDLFATIQVATEAAKAKCREHIKALDKQCQDWLDAEATLKSRKEQPKCQ